MARRPPVDFPPGAEALDLEIATLGGLLLEGGAAIQQYRDLPPTDFLLEGHRVIFTVMQELAGRGAIVDVATVADELRRRGQLDEVGGMVKLSQLAEPLTACIPAHLRGYVDRVLDYGLKRESKRWAMEYLSKAENGVGAQQLIEDVSAHLTTLRNRPIGTPRTPECVEIPGGYLVTWPRSEVAVRFDTARDDRDGHTAEAAVYVGDRLLAFGKVGLASLQSRKSLASAIEVSPPFSTWPQLI
jgi:hypothetical protein